MKRKIIALLLSVTTISMAVTGCGVSGSTAKEVISEITSSGDAKETLSEKTDTSSVSASVSEDVSELFTSRDLSGEYDESESESITLNGTSGESTDEGVTISDGIVTIAKGGTYILSGNFEGMIKVDADDSDKVQLVLDGVSITNNGNAAIYVLNADKVFITLADESVNSLSHNGSYEVLDDNNIDGVIFSKEDLVINGTGTLNITAKDGNGIVSKDDLKIASGTINIEADNNGLEGKDSVRIADGNISITCGQDGIHSDNDEDEDKGYVYIAGGNIAINAGDDGVHAGNTTTVAGGTIDIAKSYEGLEGNIVNITGGNISIVATDDGINAAGGSDGSGFGPYRQDSFGSSTGDTPEINISGGIINVNADGDGVDSNGMINISGGEIYVSGPENNGNGALDYELSATITGGIVVAAGASGMAENFGDASTQGSIMINTQSTHKAGETISLKDSDGNVLVSYTAESSFNNIVISHPDIKEGETYTITAGSEETEITMDSLIYGSGMGMGGFGGGFGGRGMEQGMQNDQNGQQGQQGRPNEPFDRDDFNPGEFEGEHPRGGRGERGGF